MYVESRSMILMTVLVGKEWRRSYREQTCGHIGDGESGMNAGSIIDIYTPPRVKWIAGEKLLCNTGGPAWYSVLT